MPYIGSVQRTESNRLDGYIMEVSFQSRAVMYGDTNYGQTVSEVYGVPTTVLFPNNPDKGPAIFIHYSLEVNENVQEQVLETREVKSSMAALIKGKSSLMEPWEHGDKFTAEFKFEDGRIKMTGKLDVSDMNEKEAAKFFDVYVSKIEVLNKNIERENRLAYSEYAERESDAAEKRQKNLLGQQYTSITDPEVFQTIVGWRLNSTLLVEEPLSDYGHWEYEDTNADSDENVMVEVVNYGDRFEMMFFVEYDGDLDEDQIVEMVDELNEKLAGKMPKGASSAVVEDSDYEGLAAVVVNYSLAGGPKGKETYSWAEKFDGFVGSWYRDMRDITDQY